MDQCKLNGPRETPVVQKSHNDQTLFETECRLFSFSQTSEREKNGPCPRSNYRCSPQLPKMLKKFAKPQQSNSPAVWTVCFFLISRLPRLICLELRLRRQHPIISTLINTNDVPDAMPTISNVPEMACVGGVLVVGGPPSDEAGWPVGGASAFQFPVVQLVYHVVICIFIAQTRQKIPTNCFSL